MPPMKHPRVGEVRPSQVIFSYGVGALVDLPHLSVLVMGLDDWTVDGGISRVIDEERLLRAVRAQLGSQVQKLLAPPALPAGSGPVDPFSDLARIGIPVALFPRWMLCPRCQRLSPLSTGLFSRKEDAFHPDRTRYVHTGCEEAKEPVVVPARFLVACDHGHLGGGRDFATIYAALLRGEDELTKRAKALNTNAQARFAPFTLASDEWGSVTSEIVVGKDQDSPGRLMIRLLKEGRKFGISFIGCAHGDTAASLGSKGDTAAFRASFDWIISCGAFVARELRDLPELARGLPLGRTPEGGTFPLVVVAVSPITGARRLLDLRGIDKVAGGATSHATLTPALSRWERESDLPSPSGRGPGVRAVRPGPAASARLQTNGRTHRPPCAHARTSCGRCWPPAGASPRSATRSRAPTVRSARWCARSRTTS